MKFFGIVYIVSTTLILIFRKEKINSHENIHSEMTISKTFKSLWQILKLKPIQQFIIILLTCKVNK